jgi:hypothetical protein
VEPITTIAATAAALFAKKALEEAGGSAGKALSAAAGRLVGWVRRLASKDPEAGAAVTMIHCSARSWLPAPTPTQSWLGSSVA